MTTTPSTQDGWTAPVKALRAALIELGQDVRRFDDAGLLRLALGRGDAPVPAWADKTADERIKALREDYKRPVLLAPVDDDGSITDTYRAVCMPVRLK